MTKLTLTTIALLLSSICFIACKKKHQAESENLLVGDWREAEKSGQSLSLKFNKEHAFWFSAIASGTSMKYSGIYRVNGNALKLTATEMSVQEPGKAVQTTAVNDALFAGATYSISNDTLTVTYQAHTAMWPALPTTVKLRRMITID